jgi:2-oxoglutarate ferredoxin oxidoreductase subunit alpha
MGGARAMTATSGPGMSLYSESLGLAIMGEIPLVVVDVQRLGPATGGATTVGQGDVQFARWGTSGGYPIVVLAPSTIAECYTLTMRSFDLAERFRSPVVLLTDKELNLTTQAVDADDLAPVPVRERPLASGGAPYRYDPEDGVPPMRRYGDGLVRFTGSTHDEQAVITKNPATVGALNRHLAAKIDAHSDELELAVLDLEPEATTLVVSYGTTAGSVREAVRRRRAEGRPVSAVTVHSLWPVPERTLSRALQGVDRVVVAELNLGQYRREIERIAGAREVIGVHRVDGELITPTEILEAVP